MKGDQKKVVSNEQKPTQNPSKHQREPFQTTFQSTQTNRDPPRGLWPVRLPPKWPKRWGWYLGQLGQSDTSIYWEARIKWNHSQASKQQQPDCFPAKKIHRGPSGRGLAQSRKIQDFDKIRVRKSYFQSFPDFFQNILPEQTRMKVVRTWNEGI